VARHKLPTVYWQRFFATNGGLVSHGPDLHELFRLAAGYVDRILKGEKPADLHFLFTHLLALAQDR
jgi:putative tryptophan/tyrosine transport system substrate-binding protein